MRYLQGLNWVLLAAACTMTTVLSVVLLIYWVYRDEPIIQASFDSLITQCSMFFGFALITALGAQSLRKRWNGYWLIQIGQYASLALIVNYYLP